MYFTNTDNLTCILVEIGWVCKSTISKSSDKQWLGFKRSGNSPSHWTEMLAEMA